METEKIARPSVAALDEILGERIPVLEDGFVRVIDYMGNDASIVQAARVSYGAGPRRSARTGAEPPTPAATTNNHPPFEMCEIKLHVRVPMDIWRQWIRHRTANVNEYSTRYSVAIDTAKTTAPAEWRLQAADNKQGSAGTLDPAVGAELSRQEVELQKNLRAVYEHRLEVGVAREQARKDLPLSTYTEAYWKMDLHNLLHFLDLRMHPHAQAEIRAYAEAIGHRIVRPWVPLTWAAFQDYRLDALRLTGPDCELLALLTAGDKAAVRRRAEEIGWLTVTPEGQTKPGREAREFEQKAARIGVKVEW
jgi:thymidylate synthase (FAD)